jgi:hypothetical protein
MKTKINLFMMFITSLICLLPLFYGILVYNQLSDLVGIPIFGFISDGNHNMYFHKAYFVFGMPLILLAINVILRIIIYKKPIWLEKEPKAMQTITEWVCPVLSLIAVPLWLFRAMGATVPIEFIIFIFVGLIIILNGNYLPKAKIDKTSIFGVKLAWMQNMSDETWIRGRRNVGYLWIIIGTAYIILAFLLKENPFTLLASYLITIPILIVVPIFYAYLVFLTDKQKFLKVKKED